MKASVNYQLPDGRIVPIHFDQYPDGSSEYAPLTVPFGLASGRTVIALRVSK